jgi:hypothetical protein
MGNTLKARWNAAESKIGKFLKNQLALFLILCSAVGAANEYLALIPADWVPIWVKTLVPVAGLISFVAGKLTKQDAPDPAGSDSDKTG